MLKLSPPNPLLLCKIALVLLPEELTLCLKDKEGTRGSLQPRTCNRLQALKNIIKTAGCSSSTNSFNPLHRGNVFQVTSSTGELLKQQRQ